MEPPAVNDDTQTFRLLRKTRTGGLSAEQLTQLQLAESDPASEHAAILVAEDSEPLRAIMVLMLHALMSGKKSHSGTWTTVGLRSSMRSSLAFMVL